jgi:hypothetical protein
MPTELVMFEFQPFFLCICLALCCLCSDHLDRFHSAEVSDLSLQ